jgi:hypothetical protein
LVVDILNLLCWEQEHISSSLTRVAVQVVKAEGSILFGYISATPAALGARDVSNGNAVCFSEACAVISNVFAVWIIINIRYTWSDA